jgi:hypothetical protein
MKSMPFKVRWDSSVNKEMVSLILGRNGVVLYTTISISVLGPIGPPVRWVSRAVFTGAAVKLATDLQVMSMLRLPENVLAERAAWKDKLL